MKSFDTVTEAVRDLQARGYVHDFRVNHDCLLCDEKETKLAPEEFEVDEVYRYEGNTDPGDENVVYGISSAYSDLKGILVMAFGTYAEEISGDLIEKLRYTPKS